MIGWLIRLFRRPAESRPQLDRPGVSAETHEAITIAQEVRRRMDTQTTTRRREVAAIRLDQMRLRQSMRDNPVTRAITGPRGNP